MLPTVICALILALIFGSIVFCGIRNKKKGKGCGSCVGGCGACGMGCHENKEENAKNK